MMSDLGWQSLEAQRAVSRLTLMFKFVHGLVNIGSQTLVGSIACHQAIYRTALLQELPSTQGLL